MARLARQVVGVAVVVLAAGCSSSDKQAAAATPTAEEHPPADARLIAQLPRPVGRPSRYSRPRRRSHRP